MAEISEVELWKLQLAQRNLELLCAAIDWQIQRGGLNARSVPGDVRLDISEEIPLMDDLEALALLKRYGYLGH